MPDLQLPTRYRSRRPLPSLGWEGDDAMGGTGLEMERWFNVDTLTSSVLVPSSEPCYY